jgi:hypothetical protein
MYTYNRDYILRLLEELGKVLSRIKGLVINQQLAEALILLDGFLEEIGFDKANYHTYSPLDFTRLIINEKKLKDEEIEIIGTVLLKKGEVLLMMNDGANKGLDCIYKSQLLLEYVNNRSHKEVSLGRLNKIDSCKSILFKYK